MIVNDVVTDWSYALAGFLFPLFLVFPPANPIFHIAFYPDVPIIIS